MTTLPPTTRELSQLRPAEVVTRPVRRHRAAARQLPRGQHVQTLVGTHRALDREVARLGRAVLGQGERHLIQSGPRAGYLELRVIVRDSVTAPRWAKVLIGVGSGISVLAALGIALAWTLASLSLPALAMFAAVVLGGLYLLVRHGSSRRARGVFVQTTTSVHVR